MVVEMQRGCIGFVFWIPDGAIASPDHKELRIILIWTGIIYKNIIQNVGKYADIIISLLIFYVLNIYPGNTNATTYNSRIITILIQQPNTSDFIPIQQL